MVEEVGPVEVSTTPAREGEFYTRNPRKKPMPGVFAVVGKFKRDPVESSFYGFCVSARRSPRARQGYGIRASRALGSRVRNHGPSLMLKRLEYGRRVASGLSIRRFVYLLSESKSVASRAKWLRDLPPRLHTIGPRKRNAYQGDLSTWAPNPYPNSSIQLITGPFIRELSRK